MNWFENFKKYSNFSNFHFLRGKQNSQMLGKVLANAILLREPNLLWRSGKEAHKANGLSGKIG